MADRQKLHASSTIPFKPTEQINQRFRADYNLAVQRQYELPLGVARSHYPNNECRLLAKRSDN
jgi:hypothetical protein